MLTFIRQKLFYKKWLNACLLLGIVILVAVASCLPMYQNMAENQTFQNQMKEYVHDEGCFATTLQVSKGRSYKNPAKAYDKMTAVADQYGQILEADLALTPTEQVTVYALGESDISLAVNAGKRQQGKKIKICRMTDFEEHAKILSETAPDNGSLGCYVSAAMLDTNHLYVGQELTFTGYTDADGQPVRLVIAGVFEEQTSDDAYWVKAPSAYTTQVFVSEDTMREILSTVEKKVDVRVSSYFVYDYSKMETKKLSGYYKALKRYEKNGVGEEQAELKTDFTAQLKTYRDQANRIRAILWVLELPILVLILIFIYMISAQILELEGNEIAMLKSRGVSVRQILWVYFCQAGVLAAIGMFLGIPIGYGICRLMGQCNAFLEFVNRKHLVVAVTGEALAYAAASAFIAVACMTLPLLRSARVDIVARKSKRTADDRSLFDRYYLDVAALLVAGYAYYSFRGQKEELAQRVMDGKGLDPLLFLSAVIFMVGAGMVLVRLLRLLTKGIYRLGRRRWSPAIYASFLQILRTRGRQTFITLFLVVSLAMGIFYSNVARTINQNEEDRVCYDIGADMVIKEQWKAVSLTYKEYNVQKTKLYYQEPSTNLYDQVKDQVQSATKVIRRDARLTGKETLTTSGQVMAIQTQEFGQTAWMRDGLLDQHWYTYLNALAENAENVLVSSNAAEAFGLKVGDTITYSVLQENEDYEDTMEPMSGTICGFVDAWPGFTGYQTVEDEDGNQSQEAVYLVIANYSYVENSCGAQPYEIWMQTDGDNQAVLDTVEECGATLEYEDEAAQELTLAKQSAMVQITNGMLTLSFLVVMVLCMIGFLIYWMTSIRQRELLFGIYRAMGMRMREVFAMLVNEQVFCSLTAIVCGVLSGAVTSGLFISLITIAYAPEKHVLPYRLYVSAFDMIRIGVVVAVMLAGGIFALVRMLAGMKIAQAIKMGED